MLLSQDDCSGIRKAGRHECGTAGDGEIGVRMQIRALWRKGVRTGFFAGAKIGLVTGWVVDESHAVMQFLDLQPGDSVPDAKTI